MTGNSVKNPNYEKEKDFIKRLTAGEESAFKELTDRFGDKVYRLALRFTKNPEDAEELLQEVFLTIFRKIHTFQGRSALSTWIYAITSNTSLSFLRKKESRPATTFEDSGLNERKLEALLKNHEKEWPEDIKDPVLRNEIGQKLYEAISSLPPEYKEIFVLKEIEKLPLKEIAKIFPLSIGAIKTRLHRARLILRSALGDYFKEWKQ